MPERNALIYVVDDDEAVRRAMSRLLEAAGFAVKSYESALAFLSDAPVRSSRTCLVLDVFLPGMTGLELVEHMTKTEMDIPTILITAYEREHGWQDNRPPVLACLRKPVDEIEILELIEKGLSMQNRSSH